MPKDNTIFFSYKRILLSNLFLFANCVGSDIRSDHRLVEKLLLDSLVSFSYKHLLYFSQRFASSIVATAALRHNQTFRSVLANVLPPVHLNFFSILLLLMLLVAADCDDSDGDDDDDADVVRNGPYDQYDLLCAEYACCYLEFGGLLYIFPCFSL